MLISEKLKPLKNQEIINLLINSIGFLLLIAKVILTKTPPTYDEPYHLKTVESLNNYGFSLQFLRGTDVSAPGPLYAIVHYLFQGITNLQVPGIRLVNIIFLFGIIVILILTFRQMKYQKLWFLSFGIMSVPIIWPISGMALTEIPSMFFACLSIFLLLVALDSQSNFRSLLISSIAGVSFGFSILGRQTFLVMLLALPLLTVQSSNKTNAKNIWKYILVFFTTAIIMPAIQFYLWGGLLPGGQSGISRGFSITHGLLSLAYAGVVMIIIAPNWFSLGWKFNLKIFLITLPFNLIFGFFDIKPAMTIAQRLFSDSFQLIYSRGASSFLLAIGIIFGISTINNMWKNRNDHIFLFLCFSVLLLDLSAIKITHLFSSRYTATSVPFMLLVSSKYSQDQEDYWKLARTLFGNTLGFLTLSSYLN
ncbi:glycosyltransferase family 39 protein [Nodularia sphaerocarpa]|uniref:glycosyltransferase family 39 protein n=1 Tax=Nodularia sphaerocarpa TaxID=137816 RepID=UPI001EFA5746|nr:glycosyltransferase family 39 protein [Nodularia sphaerocarpa]MDB9375961.1 glycosyltransferase family 39 protein [Nodularia sphaerocarpa CS-585]MDB9377153.1 glycosyltransferase family 39 protein [Nodularia sphaerocarpa CS-585A2]ULP74670.1 hypothetical protein BDGGKGIB_04339 [Nodularia sphaerocarpa UHCC 0038]